jgi:sialidase-1
MSLRLDGGGSRGQALSNDGGATFEWSAPTIPNWVGGVQQPLITLANGTLVYAAPTGPGRSKITVFTSDDDAATWQALRQIYDGPSAYSSLAQRSDGAVALAYERDVDGCDGESCSIQFTML